MLTFSAKQGIRVQTTPCTPTLMLHRELEGTPWKSLGASTSKDVKESKAHPSNTQNVNPRSQAHTYFGDADSQPNSEPKAITTLSRSYTNSSRSQMENDDPS
jgi:hypothetical protein